MDKYGNIVYSKLSVHTDRTNTCISVTNIYMLFMLHRVTSFALSNDYSATGCGTPGRKPQMVRLRHQCEVPHDTLCGSSHMYGSGQ